MTRAVSSSPRARTGEAGAGVLAELLRTSSPGADLMALAVVPRVGLGLAVCDRDVSLAVAVEEPSEVVALVEEALQPRWVVWSNDTAALLASSGVRLAKCWDLAAVHRLLFGGWRADPGRIWARVHELAPETIPTTAPADLFGDVEDGAGDPEDPVRPDGHLRAEWTAGGWRTAPDRIQKWAEVAASVALLQQARLKEPSIPSRTASTARSESAAELLCAEMSVEGLPMRRTDAEEIIAGFIGPRPRSDTEAAEHRARRDAEVLRHAPAGVQVDLRSPGQVKSLLRQVGVDIPDTRAWRLQALRDAHPLIDPLLAWRKAERVATTYGYAWLDAQLGGDDRLRGAWTGSDGAAGRMTASAGLHNMPSEMRGAVVAEAGHIFVRADLGQIEPRVLAAVSGDAELARATWEEDMYAPVAGQLGVDRATAKVAMLGAMYGQTTGHGRQALRRLEAAFPDAMGYLEEAARSGHAGRDLRTYGGRLVLMGSPNAKQLDEDEARRQAAARGRYARNALVQGAAAELFKAWAATVRARGAPFDARIVLCLHDELLVHAPVEHGDAVLRLVDECLQEAAYRWAPDKTVRFVADVQVIERWSEAKG